MKNREAKKYSLKTKYIYPAFVGIYIGLCVTGIVSVIEFFYTDNNTENHTIISNIGVGIVVVCAVASILGAAVNAFRLLDEKHLEEFDDID